MGKVSCFPEEYLPLPGGPRRRCHGRLRFNFDMGQRSFTDGPVSQLDLMDGFHVLSIIFAPSKLSIAFRTGLGAVVHSLDVISNMISPFEFQRTQITRKLVLSMNRVQMLIQSKSTRETFATIAADPTAINDSMFAIF